MFPVFLLISRLLIFFKMTASLYSEKVGGQPKRKESPTLGSSPGGKNPKTLNREKLNNLQNLISESQEKHEKLQDSFKNSKYFKQNTADSPLISAIMTMMTVSLNTLEGLNDAVIEIADSMNDGFSDLSCDIGVVSADLDKCNQVNKNLENANSISKVMNEMHDSDSTVELLDFPSPPFLTLRFLLTLKLN